MVRRTFEAEIKIEIFDFRKMFFGNKGSIALRGTRCGTDESSVFISNSMKPRVCYAQKGDARPAKLFQSKIQIEAVHLALCLMSPLTMFSRILSIAK